MCLPLPADLGGSFQFFYIKKLFYYYYNNNVVFNPTSSCPGRLLRANQISFNWDRLASWINLTEQWPYRTSWLILYLEETDGVPDHAMLKTIYERSEVTLPLQVSLVKRRCVS